MEGDEIAWWSNDGNENFTKITINNVFDNPSSVHGIDLDGDLDTDVLGTAWLAGDISWWENDGNENFIKHTIDGDFNGAHSVTATDIDSDGNIDILATASQDNDITWWENDGNENFTEHTLDSDFTYARSACAIDLDGDYDIDIIGAALYESHLSWWENDGNENFTQHSIPGTGGGFSVSSDDVDGDTFKDIVTVAFFGNRVTLFTQFPVLRTTFQFSLSIQNGWNMISVPGLHPTDQNISTWWVYRDPSANVFKYSGGYFSVDSTVAGEGYWMKHLGSVLYILVRNGLQMD